MAGYPKEDMQNPVLGQQPIPVVVPSNDIGTTQQIIIVQDGIQTPTTTKSKVLFALGVVQVILGCLLIIVNGFAYYGWASFSSHIGAGFWVGVVVIITGGFGIACGKQITKCRVVTHMVMSIISAVFIWAVILISIFGVIFDFFLTYNSCNNGVCVYYNASGVAVNSLLILTGFIEFIIAVVSSAVCCKILHDRSKDRQQIAYVQTPLQNPGEMYQGYPPPYPQAVMAPPPYNQGPSVKE